MTVTADDLLELGQGRFTDRDLAESTLVRVWGAVRSYCEWHIAPVQESVTLVVDGPGSPVVQLPTLRLLDVLEVREEDRVVDRSAFMWSADGSIKKRVGCWTREWRGIEVVCTHGFDSAPGLDAVVLEVAARELTAPAGQNRLRVGQVDESFGSGSVSFFGSDYTLLDKYALHGTG